MSSLFQAVFRFWVWNVDLAEINQPNSYADERYRPTIIVDSVDSTTDTAGIGDFHNHFDRREACRRMQSRSDSGSWARFHLTKPLSSTPTNQPHYLSLSLSTGEFGCKGRQSSFTHTTLGLHPKFYEALHLRSFTPHSQKKRF